MRDEVPLLLLDPVLLKQYVQHEGSVDSMEVEYEHHRVEKRGLQLMKDRIKYWVSRDFRTAVSRNALDTLMNSLKPGDLALSIGGGPMRVHEALVNLNIGPFPNVDIVADAHSLPYSSGCVDAIHCEAVLEHVRTPVKVVEEMLRVLKPGGRVYACTPFLQNYHGYPNHFQNFTLTGHCALFEDRGFRIIESGVAVGPMVALTDMASTLAAEFAPAHLRNLAYWFVRLGGLVVRPLDIWMNRAHAAYVLASSTFLVAERPK